MKEAVSTTETPVYFNENKKHCIQDGCYLHDDEDSYLHSLFSNALSTQVVSTAPNVAMVVCNWKDEKISGRRLFQNSEK